MYHKEYWENIDKEKNKVKEKNYRVVLERKQVSKEQKSEITEKKMES